MDSLSSDHLRTFLAILEAGSVTGGAARIGRSQSATSLQIRQLEATVGTALFHRHGRGVTLTAAGETLRPVARQVTQSLDSALAELRGGGLKGRLRIGMPDDHSRSELARIIAAFAERHPDVELEVQCALGTGFEAAVKAGALDLAVHEVPEPSPGDFILRENSLVWMRGGERDFADDELLPVALFDRDCWWRDVALSSLRESGRRHQVVFTSESAVGVKAAVKAGIAVGLLSEAEGEDDLRRLPDLAPPQRSLLVIRRAEASVGPVFDAMCDAISTAFTAR